MMPCVPMEFFWLTQVSPEEKFKIVLMRSCALAFGIRW
jgi:hypothetical protein